mgnify:CR=1 FL=1
MIDRPQSESPILTRRELLSNVSSGASGLALTSILFKDGYAAEIPSDVESIQTAPAKSVIWLFMAGGVSHMESFDIKPALNKYAGKTFEETPFKDFLDKDRIEKNLAGQGMTIPPHKELKGLSTGYKKYGECGLEVGDWFQHIGECADDLAIVRSLWTVHPNHGMQLTWHTGHHVREGAQPTIGSWVAYGLGSLNEELPEFLVLGNSIGGCCGGEYGHGASHLGLQYAGVKLSTDPENPLPFVKPFGKRRRKSEARAELELINQLNNLSLQRRPEDAALEARIKSYELAAKMQTSAPDLVSIQQESQATLNLYGINHDHSREFGTQCLIARRMVEAGVRFIQIYHGTGGAGKWDAHSDIKKKYDVQAPAVDQPISGLLKDLKQRGLLDSTLVVFGTEFGRTPGAQGTGRDHHPQGFTCWLAGGGIKGGITHGATDELGFYAVDNPHYVTDVHATVLHQLGLDSHKLEIPGRKRLDIHRGLPIDDIIA